MFVHLCIDAPKRQQLVLKFQLPGKPVLYKVIAFAGMLHGGETIFDERENQLAKRVLVVFEQCVYLYRVIMPSLL